MPRTPLAAALWIAAAALAAHAASFAGAWQLDDFPAIVSNERLDAPPTLGAILTGPAQSTVAGRPVVNLTIYLSHKVGGGAIWSFHLFNLALHAANALLVFSLALRLQGAHRIFPRRGALAGPFLAALLWAVHPIGTSAVAYVVQRAEALVVFFLLAAIRLHLADEASRRRPAIAAAQGLIVLAGLFTKEIMAAVLPVFLLYDLRVAPGAGVARVRRSAIYYAAVLAAFVPFAVYYSSMPRNASAGFGLQRTGPADYAFSQLHVAWMYVFRLLWPAWQVFDYGPFQRPGAVATLLCAAGWAAALIVAGIQFLRRPVLFFGVAAVALVLAPTTSFIPLLDCYFEHRIYGPVAVAAMALAAGAFRARTRGAGSRRLAVLALAMAVAVPAVLTARRSLEFRSQERMCADTILKRPANPRPFLTMGERAEARGADAEAEDWYRRAIAVNSGVGFIHLRLALLLTRQSRHADAVAHYQLALRLGLPPSVTTAQLAVIHNNLGVALGESGDSAAAIQAYEDALRLDPGYADARANLEFERHAASAPR